MKDADRIFTNLDGSGEPGLAGAMKRGEWTDTAACFKKSPAELLALFRESGMRGRGIYGQKTADKWERFIRESEGPRFLVVSANEGEPGTCKNKFLLRNETYKLLEGCLLAAYVTGVHQAVIYVRGTFSEETKLLEKAIAELYDAGYFGRNILGSGFDFDVTVHRGGGAYVCRVDSALFKSIEGRRPYPSPPAFREKGLYGAPTLVHSIETLAVLPVIVRRGADWFASLGRADNEGTRLFSIEGNVRTPCLVEEQLGIPMRDLIDRYGGGVEGGWANLQAVLPGGISTSFLSPGICEHVRMDYDSLSEVYSGVGTGAVIVMDMSADLPAVLEKIVRFFHAESCGACVCCREGCARMAELTGRIVSGQGKTADIALLEELCEQMDGNALCAVGNMSVRPVLGFLRHFRRLLEERCHA